MNEDILKGKWLEIKGRVKEKWGRLTDNDLFEIEGKGEKLLGLLRKKYGYIRDKAELEYKDGVELAEIVSSIREIMTRKKDIMAIAFIYLIAPRMLRKKLKKCTPTQIVCIQLIREKLREIRYSFTTTLLIQTKKRPYRQSKSSGNILAREKLP